VFVARRGSSPQWPGRRGRPWRPRRHQPRSPTMSGRPRSSRWLVRPPRLGRWAGPVRWAGLVRSAGLVQWAGLVKWADMPPGLLLRPPCSDSTLGARKASPGRLVPRARPGHPAQRGRSRTHTPRPPPRRLRTGRQPSRPGLLLCHRPRRLRFSGTRGVLRGRRCRRRRPGQKCRRCRRCRPRQILFWLRRTLSRLRPILFRRGQIRSRRQRLRSWGWRRRWPGWMRLRQRGRTRLRLRGRIRRRPLLPPGPRSVGQQRGTRSHRSACQQGRLRGLRRGPGRIWRGGWLRLPRRRLLRLRPPCLRHASPGRPDSSSAWTRPG
jgi:hypothetical protein